MFYNGETIKRGKRSQDRALDKKKGVWQRNHVEWQMIKCAILSTTQRNPESWGLLSPEYVSRESVDLAVRSLRHKVCSRQLWQNSM
jgi:hypothetical protein